MIRRLFIFHIFVLTNIAWPFIQTGDGSLNRHFAIRMHGHYGG